MATSASADKTLLYLLMRGVSLAYIPVYSLASEWEQEAEYELAEGSFLDWFLSNWGYSDVEFMLLCYGYFLCSRYNQERFYTMERLKVSITRHYGSVSVEMGLESDFEISSPAARKAAYDTLISAVNSEHDRLSAGGSIPQSSGGISSSGGGGREVLTVACTRMTVEMKSGKRYYKVQCGEWQQHGVNYWPETMRLNGVDPTKIPDVGYSLDGYMADVEMVDGKAKRVLKVYKANGG